MTDNDWDEYLYGSSPTYDEDNESTPQEEQDCQIIKHLGIQRESEKAKFYVTQNEFSPNSDGKIKGMWIPKAAIISSTKKEVIVKDWCRLTTVEWK